MALISSDVHPYASFWLDVADKAIKFVAVLVGASWTWINYKRSRTYKRKLEPTVSAEFFEKGGAFYTLVSCRLRNVGQSIYTLEQKGTALEAVTLSEHGRTIVSTSTVFVDHGWIEPGEQIDEPLVVPIPDPETFVALRLNLRVVSSGIEWNVSCVARNQASE